MQGETVFVELREEVGRDSFNAPIYEVKPLIEVANVLVCPELGGDITAGIRTEGIRRTYTLHFPRTFDLDLCKSRIKVRGKWCNVIGFPSHFIKENCPGPWSEEVKVVAVDG